MLDQLNDAAVPGERTNRGQGAGVRGVQPLYTRSMPGGGSVRVELVVSDRGDAGTRRRRGRVVIESRELSASAAEGGRMVVEELEGDENDVVDQLFRIARDNAAIARRVLRCRSRAQRAD